MTDLLPVDEVIQRILERMMVLDSEEVPVDQTLGRVLAADVIAGENVPPFANSSMDGYAVRAADTLQADADSPVRLSVVGTITAGTVLERVIAPGEAARIMTGAPMPPGADAVVPVEQTGDHWQSDGRAPLPESVTIYRRVQPGENVRPVGEDIRAGQTVLQAKTILRPQDIGVLVSLGWGRVPVIRQPRVAVLSTGDELVDVNEPLAPGKIRNSNSYVLSGLVTMCGAIPIRLPMCHDSLEDVRRCFRETLAHRPDLLLSSGGVSVGTHDVVRTVVDELGHINLWRVNVRPGKPLVFGEVQGVPFFGLPGNPVSAMVTFDIFVRPALRVMGGQPSEDTATVMAVVGEHIRSDGRRSYLRVKLTREADTLVARTTGTQSSAVLLSMVQADGLLIIPEGMADVPVGTSLPVRLLRHL